MLTTDIPQDENGVEMKQIGAYHRVPSTDGNQDKDFIARHMEKPCTLVNDGDFILVYVKATP